MSQRFKIAILVVLGIFLVIGIISVSLYLWPSRAPEPGVNINKALEEQVSTLPLGPEKTSSVVISPETPAEGSATTSLRVLVMSFTERFGSFSNETSYENLRDLEVLMTIKMRLWAEKFIKESLADEAKGPLYYGMTTKALFYKVIFLDENAGQARFLVAAQRQEAKGHPSNTRIFYQDLMVHLVKEEDVWKVDGAYWQ